MEEEKPEEIPKVMTITREKYEYDVGGVPPNKFIILNFGIHDYAINSDILYGVREEGKEPQEAYIVVRTNPDKSKLIRQIISEKALRKLGRKIRGE
jgi:hypothetical protein